MGEFDADSSGISMYAAPVGLYRVLPGLRPGRRTMQDGKRKGRPASVQIRRSEVPGGDWYGWPMSSPDSTCQAVDAYPPKEIALRMEEAGVQKARLAAGTLLLLAILAGAFISVGALFYIVVVSGSSGNSGALRLLGGVAFSLGLVLVVVAGAELFTGNNLIAMAWASRRVTSKELFRNWALSYGGNVAGCLLTAAFVRLSGVVSLDRAPEVATTLLGISSRKADLSPVEGFFRGLLCNALVCLAVWLCMGGRSVTDKVLAVIFPVAAFVAIGFEHSIANWFILPLAALVGGSGSVPAGGAAANLVFVTLGNIAGGTLLVAAVYWQAYSRGGGRSGP